MANLINLERATLTLGTTRVLDGVSLGINPGDRVGVVGRNGGGKTTLVRVIAGHEPVDAGRVSRTGGVSAGLLGQADELDPAHTVREAVLGDLPEHEWAGDARVRDVLTGLIGGVDAQAVGGMAAQVGTRSGGERRRLALARVLIDDPDVLILDEPTNHLDVEVVAWLADHLVTQRARADNALVAITHDRWFLDAVATSTWEVHDGQVDIYDGGYAAYVLARAERERVAAVTAERRDNLLRKELAWLRRGPPARTSKPKFRIEAANALIAEEPPPRDDVELMRFATTRLGKDVIDLHDADVVLGGRSLLHRVTWHLGPGDRVGIIGVNGSGKSTLLRVLAGELPLTAGTRKVGVTVRVALLSQEVRELERMASWRVIDAIEDVRAHTTLGGKDISAAQLAMRLGFTGGRQQTRVADLSGGERRRLQLVRLLLDEPNVLLLDEPTNDLDIETLTSLEDVLDGWAGTLVVVSHDRYLLERITDRQLAVLGDGGLRDLPGGVDEYLRLRREGLASGRAPRTAPSEGASRAAQVERASSPRAGEESVGAPRPSDHRAARKTMARVEKQLARIAEREERLHVEMADAGTDHERLAELSERLQALAEEKQDLEVEWLEAAETVS